MTKNNSGYVVPDGVTVDVIMFNELGDIMMIRRNNDTHNGMIALPGGHIDEGEDAKIAAIREIKEETGIGLTDLRLFNVYSSKDRDPRGWYITIVYCSYVPDYIMLDAKPSSDAKDIVYLDHVVTLLPTMAFDHAQIIADFRKEIHGNKLLR